jgi:ubiquinone/menaquinone biosynthesis C-methylase UbiE
MTRPKQYAKIYEDYYRPEFIENNPKYFLRRKVLVYSIKRYCPNSRDLTVLDVGCGTGHLLHLISREAPFRKKIGCDVSETAIEIGSSLFKDISFVLADIYKLPFKDIDVVLCSEVIEHVRDDSRALKEIYRILSSGGLLFLTVPFDKNNWTFHDEFFKHYRRYDKDATAKLLENIGFKIKHVSTFGFPFIRFFVRVMNIPMRMGLIRAKGGKNKPRRLFSLLTKPLLLLSLLDYFIWRYVKLNKGHNILFICEK